MNTNNMKYQIQCLFIIIYMINNYKCHQVLNSRLPDTAFKTSDYALPAPGIRYPTPRQSKVNRRQTSIIENFVGNLLPQDENVGYAEVLSLDVACERNQMTTRVIFDRPFKGIIYSKGHYSSPKCRHVKSGSGLREHVFVVTPGTCGTQYVGNPGQPPYLENVLIIQNTPGIQEVSDTARGVRCIFDDTPAKLHSKQTVSANLNVALMDHKYVTFSADTKNKASASLDIQVGRGPHGPSASGLVRIGELMTMVVKVDGAEKADVLVRSCTANDGAQASAIQLTDKEGCVLKKKIMGSWQKTSNIKKKSSDPVMAYAHFQAFKFPDQLDVYIECEVELCSISCPVCPSDTTNRRIKREVLHHEEIDSTESKNSSNGSEKGQTNSINNINLNRSVNGSLGGVKVAKRLRVLSPEDLSSTNKDISSITLVTKRTNGTDQDVCLSLVSFISGLVTMLVVLVLSSVLTALLCIRVRSLPSVTSTYLPDSSFHAFSTVSGKTGKTY